MNTADTHELEQLCDSMASRASDARRLIAHTTGDQRRALLHEIADAIRVRTSEILGANQRDLEANTDLDDALRDRLLLDAVRVEGIAAAVDRIADQPDPVGRIVDGRVLPNGVRLEKRRVPIGTILVIYESRPNVTVDAAALCLKAGNSVILRGGKEALHSNTVFADTIRSVLARHALADAVQLVPTTDRAATTHLVRMNGRIDLCIPRGGAGLIKAVAQAATIPVVKHDAGNCHLYIDAHLDEMEDEAIAIAMNCKTHRYGVCNAIETLLIHADALHILERLGPMLTDKGVELRADERARAHLPGARPATDEDYATEFLAPILAIATVDSIDEACAHIARYGSHHTEAIVTSSTRSAQRFTQGVDSANVMINCSTRFADGGEYGLGAEIGISTDKLHARGPMGAEDLTTFQWVLTGDGQIRG
ncbi:MAG: glutamate-5-semialdehyde dehydrogenase [Phycisphaerales bacterium]